MPYWNFHYSYTKKFLPRNSVELLKNGTHFFKNASPEIKKRHGVNQKSPYIFSTNCTEFLKQT